MVLISLLPKPEHDSLVLMLKASRWERLKTRDIDCGNNLGGGPWNMGIWVVSWAWEREASLSCVHTG